MSEKLSFFSKTYSKAIRSTIYTKLILYFVEWEDEGLLTIVNNVFMYRFINLFSTLNKVLVSVTIIWIKNNILTLCYFYDNNGNYFFVTHVEYS